MTFSNKVKFHFFKFFQVLGDDCNLKLSQIFRTPKDFADTNFDQFEILERNNFDSSAETSDPVLKNEIFRPPQALPKSVANAQVMVRFGGDDIHGKNYLGTLGNLLNNPSFISHPFLRQVCCNNDVPHPTYLPGYPNDIYSDPVSDLSGLDPMPAYPPTFPYYYHPFHPPPPPFAFPGMYYHPLSKPGFIPPLKKAPLTSKGKFRSLSTY